MSRRSDEETIQELLDGRLDARSFEAFEDRLRAEPELRTLFLSYSRAHHVLEEKFAQPEPQPGPQRSRPPRRRPSVVLAIAACAALLAVATFLLSRPAPAATVEFGPESYGRIVGNAGEGRLGLGARLELDHGSARVELPTGGSAYFEGPGSLEYTPDRRLRLRQGRLWVESGDARRELVCETDDLRVTAPGGEFGLIAEPGRRQELHVLGGEVMLATAGGEASPVGAGHRVAWQGAALTTAEEPLSFSAGFPRSVTLFSEDFNEPDLTPLAGKMPDVGKGPWKIDRGGPVIEHGVLDTSGNMRHAAFAPLADLPLDELSHVLLLTLETENPGTARFHSEGWAGVSLYTGDRERIFVGDPCGPEEGWALHPVGYEARHACPLLEGKTVVTLRYDFRSGLAQLFEGTDTSGPALASEWISPGLTFDRIRIANGSQADAAEDAGKPRSAAGDRPGAEVRGDIALRRITVSVLRADRERNAAQP